MAVVIGVALQLKDEVVGKPAVTIPGIFGTHRLIFAIRSFRDIDHKRLAYEGYSWGASMGSIFPAVENRFKALVLIAPGFYLQKPLPEVDELNFAPRVKTLP
jgi:cephalosporin-C deacetylase-like acetyl esterase